MSTILSSIDPAAGRVPSADQPPAQRLLRDILAEPRPARRHRTAPRPRRALAGGLIAAAAIAVFIGVDRDDGTHLGAAAYAVSRDGDGTVHVDVRWSMVTDPAGLQAALDRAGARTKVFVLTDGGQLCQQSGTVGYDAGAVDWHIPSRAGAEDGIVLHPDQFPAGATFVLVVSLAPDGATGLSTFGSSGPSITGTLSYMTTASVVSPEC
jgi:hypothetical protein